ncbi:MAG: D-alanyl-D-alanine carboxypeptidase/D-alanyl-D-alanine-endopeptidase [Acidimicrobiia bacterium]
MKHSTTARRVLAGVLALAAIGCVVAGLRQSEDTDARTESAGTSSPVWTPRRVPQLFVDAAGAASLQTTVDELVAGTDSCVRVDVAGMGTVARSGEATAVVPASTLKVVTAAGALGVLGPTFTFTTSAVSSAAPVNGSVERLWLVGGGDPVLSTPEWTARREGDTEYAGLTGSFTPLTELADSIVAAGVRAIPGGIVGDTSKYTTPVFLPTWPEGDRTEVGPLGALVVDDGFDLTTGTLVPDPALAAAITLSGMLTARGVVVGPSSTGVAPARATEVAALESVPLADLVTETLSASDNSTAEGLALAVGEAAAGSGTTAAGLTAISDALEAAGVDLTGATLADASGLSSENRLTCNILLQTIDLASQARYRAVVDGLAIAAQRGTLADRFSGTPIEGRLFAKTGTLSGTAGLTGVFDVVDGAGTPRFASVFNGNFSRAAGFGLTNGVAEAVGAYPQSPPAEQLVPPP